MTHIHCILQRWIITQKLFLLETIFGRSVTSSVTYVRKVNRTNPLAGLSRVRDPGYSAPGHWTLDLSVMKPPIYQGLFVTFIVLVERTWDSIIRRSILLHNGGNVDTRGAGLNKNNFTDQYRLYSDDVNFIQLKNLLEKSENLLQDIAKFALMIISEV